MRVILDLLHELTNTRIFDLFHNCMWQSRYSEIDVFLVERCGRTCWLSNHNGTPRSISICIYVFVCVSVFLLTFNKQIGILAVKRETFIDFLSTRTGRLFCHNGSPLSINWIRVWLGWLNDFCLSSNFWSQFLHPIMSQGNLWRRTRWFIYFFVYDFSSFHPNNFRDTISWECVVKMMTFDRVWWNFNSFFWEKFDIDPIHSVLIFLPCFMHVPYKTRCSQIDRLRILVFLIHRINGQKNTGCRLLKFCSSGINPELMMECKWWHIQRDKCTWRNHPESRHCPVMKNQQDCVLNDLEELGDKKISLENQYNTEIFSCFLLLLSWTLPLFIRSMLRIHKMTPSRGRLPWRRRLISFFDTK